MSAKHTPGPWTKDQLGFLVGSNGDRVLIADSGIGFASGFGRPERYANCRLIEAAPELLGAAVAIDANAEECEGPDGAAYMISADLLHALQDAIEKATGDDP